MSRLIPIDASLGEGGGQVVRAALALSAATGQGFEMTQIRVARPRPGLRPHHLVAVRAVALACGAKVSGAADGSLDLRFEPGVPSAGDYRFEIETGGAVSLLLQTLLPALGSAASPSSVTATGATHAAASPSGHYLARHWRAAVASLGLDVDLRVARVGFHPQGGGEVVARVRPWGTRAALHLEQRGDLRAVRGLSGAPRLRGTVSERLRDAACSVLWEARRIEVAWELSDTPAATPGAFVMLEAEFDEGRAAFSALGERGVTAERLGARAARALLRFLDSGAGAVDAPLADQLAVPMAVSRAGGRVSTPDVTSHLETVVELLSRFGIPARTWGRRGGPGGIEVDAC